MYRMVVSEFTRTLIDSEEAIPQSTVVEIDRLRREKNVVFTVMTNDPLNPVTDYNHDFPFIDYVIAFNGAYVYDAIERRTIFRKNVGISVIKKVYKLFNDLDICFYTSEYGAYWGEYRERHYSVPITNFEKFIDNHRTDVYKIAVICKDKAEVKRVLKAFDDYDINAFTRIVKRNGRIFVEIYSKLNDKVNGIKRIAKIKKIPMEEILAVVCTDTDLSVVKNVGKSVAIGNACEKIHNVCSEKTGTQDEKGVEAVLKKYF